MTTLLVLTAIGEDRPGLVEAISRTVSEHGGSWQESRMSRLANRFAGILLVNVPKIAAADLTDALLSLKSEGLQITVEVGQAEKPAADYRAAKLEIVGHDRQGIIHDISDALARHRVSIDDLETEVSSASWSGDSLCRVKAELRVPRDLDPALLRQDLEDLANEFMVELLLDDSPKA
jgi:glycine cleavage system regulatory protein